MGAAQEYPDELCMTFIDGYIAQKRWDNKGMELLASIESEPTSTTNTSSTTDASTTTTTSRRARSTAFWLTASFALSQRAVAPSFCLGPLSLFRCMGTTTSQCWMSMGETSSR